MKQTTENCNIMTMEQVKEFLTFHINYIGLGFHIDTDFMDYFNNVTDEPLYTEKTAKIANMQMSQCMDVCEKNGIDIYEIALDIMTKKYISHF